MFIKLSKLLNYFSLISIQLFFQPVYALEKLSFDVEQIVFQDWQLKGVNLSLFDLKNSNQQFSLSSKQLIFPDPFSDISFFDIHCQKFTWQDDRIDCKKGKAKLKSKTFSSAPFTFSFAISEKYSQIKISNLLFAQGNLSLKAEQKGDHWNVKLKSQDILVPAIEPLLKGRNVEITEIAKGKVNAIIEATGKDSKLSQLSVKSQFSEVSAQANQGKLALELLDFDIDLLARQKKGNWQWENKGRITQGEFYAEPLYMKIEDQGLHIYSQGVIDNKAGIAISKFVFNHPGVINISAEGELKNKAHFEIDSGHIMTTIDDLKSFSTHYISPFIEQTQFEGIKLKGKMKSEVNISQSTIQEVTSDILSLTVSDDKQRLAIDNAKGAIHWSVDSSSSIASHIQWDSIKLKAIPIEANQIQFLLNNNNVKLLQQSSLSLLGGVFNIKKFNWQHKTDDEPRIYFEGGVSDISLEQLTQALDWTPLTGTISGDIPGVNYVDKILSVNGELKVEVFDGIIKINQLASSGLFTDFSKFYMDMEIENLDLHAITQKIKMGSIEGRLSGYIKNAYFENWKPVTFYAWFGTPEDDDSRHRISQKAVENIASIGGGGATDVISKSFLRFFDTFRYDRIGFGCYLYQGVCQLMGVEAAEQGYYIIKGGGLPRIDMVGFNPRVDWNVLIERLSRISDTDEVVIE